MSAQDSGLLSPVRAGTPVEAATSDEAWLQALLDAEAGLARAQAELGVVPGEAAELIGEIARTRAVDPVSLARRSRESANPVVALVADLTASVAERDPEAAEYVHRGSTSQDIADSATMLFAHRATGLILAELERVTEGLARLAEEHRDLVMPGRTLALQAVPVTFGLKAAGWLQSVSDAEDGLRRVRDTLPAQLGGAAGTLAGYVEFARLRLGAARSARYPEDLLDGFARALGLATPVLPWHTARAPLAGLGSALAVVSGALGKLAVDVQTLSRTEIGEVSEPTGAARGVSSAMPHKQNPVLATLIRTAALQVPPLALILAQAMLAEDERPGGAWHAEWLPLRDCLRLTGGAATTAAELVEGLVVRPDRMRENLGRTGGLLVTERLAAILTPSLGRVAAKARMTEAARAGGSLRDTLLADPVLAACFDGEDLDELLAPERYTGAAARLVDRALADYRRRRSSLGTYRGR
ncbi:class-II fumarase/aspartase family protein [Amycolatopsis keratiniphila]|uniref:3-carboxy-cis,cis-muconate cycloisomerase n=1 Tax=Amycolatopsis keratiniphila subsp. keratiniphila TaxID=227715 RepID=A0A1W2LG63_9PSEU|nr:adenylosuccinate lyase family protein [Amycolatopsis keratiniphila]OLZ51205.1 3-carboxy-cis,cis-muconate cycloisomerase [Amycolatopsis keratiniphila subsp. nogabecina]ONF61881.1 3-carboxy-cis,cis-muconate cycloisomerase [Amycolatopsis keratiniphila subsp. keratiniphila]SDU30257.1 3-carboxy-cis,cis-muconate cycloisomerase [Amycolatopsis keratiniphila]